MNYSEILNKLSGASLFDLYRLRIAIDHQLKNPNRIQEIKRRLTPGKEITYFDEEENRLVEAEIIILHRTRLLVENKHDKRRWNICYYTVNLGDDETDIINLSGRMNIDRDNFMVGEHVGFYNRQNQKIYGEIIRLNPKTASILVNGKSKWRVSYSLLFKILETKEQISQISSKFK